MTTELKPAETTAAKPQSGRRWPLFWIGIALFVAGPALMFVQVGLLKYLGMPWYPPVLASLGVVCLAAWAWQKRGVWRAAVVVPFALLCGAEWFMTFVVSRTPTYAGPAQPGHELPEFTAQLADGKPFTPSVLTDGRTSVLVFNRGRW